MKILLLLLLFSFQSHAQLESPKEAINKAQRIDSARIKNFIDELKSDKICKGADFDCLTLELKNFGTKSTFAAQELLLGAFMYYFKVKTKLELTHCDVKCLMPYTAKLVNTTIEYLNSVSFEKFFLYSELKNEILESRLLRYAEDEKYYLFLQKMVPKIRAYSYQIKFSEIPDTEAAIKLKIGGFEQAISKLELGLTLRGCDIALLDNKSQMYHFYLQTLKDPKRQADFIKNHERLQGNLVRK